MTIAKIAYLQAQPGQADTLKSALLTLEIQTRAEPGCLAFRFYQSLSAPAEFVLLEHFASPAAFDLHLQADHTRAFFAQGLVASVQAHDVPVEALPGPPTLPV